MATIRILCKGGKVLSFETRSLPSGRSLNNTTVFTGEDGRVIMVKGARGALYVVSGLPTGRRSFLGWTWPWLPDFVRGLVVFGFITQEDADTTIARHKKERDILDDGMNTGTFLSYAEKLGIREEAMELLKSKGLSS